MTACCDPRKQFVAAHCRRPVTFLFWLIAGFLGDEAGGGTDEQSDSGRPDQQADPPSGERANEDEFTGA